jgi:hypothetical protein
MSQTEKIILTVVIVFGIYFVYQLLMRRWIQKRLTDDIINQRWDDFEKHINSTPAHAMISPYNREFMKLQVYMLQKDDRRMHECLDHLLEMKMTDAQAKSVYIFALNQYIHEEDNKARDVLARLKKIADPTEYHPYEILMSVYLDHDTKYMDEVKKLIQESEGAERAQYHVLMSMMYGYQGSKVMAEKEDELARKDFEAAAKLQNSGS